MKRAILITVTLLVLLALAGPFLPLNFLRPGIEGALASVLGRKVEIDSVSFTLVPAPALALKGVTIHEDPRAGVEPFTYAENVDARVNLMGLLGGRQKFSQLRFTGASLNLVKTEGDTSEPANSSAASQAATNRAASNVASGGQWNFQFLLNAAAGADVPSVQMRAGRVNIKFGQMKSVLYFADADVDISVGDNGAVDLRFSGEPMRTDRPAEEFGHFFVRGTAAPSSAGQQTNMHVELEPSSLDGLARLFGASGFDLQGQIALNAQITGPPANLELKGEMEFTDNRRSSILPQFGGKAKVGLKGTLDFTQQTLRIGSIPVVGQPFSVQIEASNVLATPQWAARLELQHAPLAALYSGARQIGAPLPDKTTLEGSLTGCVEVSSSSPVSGDLILDAPTVIMAGALPMKADTSSVTISGNRIILSPTVVAVGDDETATLEATYSVGSGSEADVRITTRGLSIAASQGAKLSGVALLGQVLEGTWRGAVQFRHSSEGENSWSGDYELLDARVAVDGLTEPVRLKAATVSANAEHTVVTRIRASAGKVAFTGDYRWEPMAERPHQFRVRIDQVEGAEVERIFKPTLERVGGFLERTLGLGAAPPAPDWLAGRHAEGTFSIRAMNVSGHSVSVDTARLVWDGTDVEITGLKGRVDDAPVQATVTADLMGRTPQYHVQGSMDDVPYRGGKLDAQGQVDAAGTGAKLLAAFRAQGSFEGRSIDFSPDVEFRNIAGKFDARVTGAGLRWKFTGLEANLGGDIYSGEGSSLLDGKVVLDMSSRGRQVHYTGSLLAAAQGP